MKKIFTFFAMTLMAMGINAQTTETALFEAGTAYGNGATLSTANCKVVLGNDRTTKNYDQKLYGPKAYCAELFGQTVEVQNEDTGEMEPKTRVVYAVGNQNPKDGELEGDQSKGTSYDPATGNLPQSGTYYMFSPAKDGKITAFITLNADKVFWICKASDGTNLPASDFIIKADGAEPTEVALNDDNTVAEKVNGTVEFDVVAGETYYMFCNGSKLGFGGYVFTFTDSGIDTSDWQETTLWEGTALVNAWADQPMFLDDGGAQLSAVGAKAGDIIRFYMSAPDTKWQAELFEGHWSGMYLRWSEEPLVNEDGSPRESIIVDLTNKGYAEFELTDEMLAAAYTKQNWGGVFLLNGDGNITVTKLTILQDGGQVGPVIEDGWMELVHNGDVEGPDGVSLVCKDGTGNGGFSFNPVEGAGIDGSRCVTITAIDNAANEWDSQFFIYTPDYTFKMGDQYKVSFWVRADKPAETVVQAHTTPGNYLGWYIDGVSGNIAITTEWKEVAFQGTVNDSMEQYGGIMVGMQTLAFNLNQDKTLANTYYFDNVSWKVKVEDEGVKEISNVRVMNGLRYNLAGQKVDDSYKGIVIQNGHKFIQK